MKHRRYLPLLLLGMLPACQRSGYPFRWAGVACSGPPVVANSLPAGVTVPGRRWAAAAPVAQAKWRQVSAAASSSGSKATFRAQPASPAIRPLHPAAHGRPSRQLVASMRPPDKRSLTKLANYLLFGGLALVLLVGGVLLGFGVGGVVGWVAGGLLSLLGLFLVAFTVYSLPYIL